MTGYDATTPERRGQVALKLHHQKNPKKMEMETIKEDHHWKPEQKNIIKWKTLTP